MRRPSPLTSACALLGLLLLGACDPPERSDDGHWPLRSSLVDRLGYDAHRVLVGSSFTVAMALDEAVVDANINDLDCIGYGASGSVGVSEDGNGDISFSMEASGPGAVTFTAPLDNCPDLTGPLAALPTDSWSLIGVEADQVVARWRSSADNDVFIWRASPGPAGAFPEALGLPLERARVVADGRFALTPVLVQPSVDPRQEVRFDEGAEQLIVPGHYAHLQPIGLTPGAGPLERLEGSLPVGDGFESSLALLGHSFPLPPIEAVAPTQIASIELIPVYLPSDAREREWTAPVGVIALTRDVEGQRIVGAPIEWSLTRGTLAVETGEPGDVLLLTDSCRASPDQPELRGATVEATIAGVAGVADLEWIALPTAAPSTPDDPNCVGSSCNCSSTADPRGSLWAALALLGLGLGRRRERSKARAR